MDMCLNSSFDWNCSIGSSLCVILTTYTFYRTSSSKMTVRCERYIRISYRCLECRYMSLIPDWTALFASHWCRHYSVFDFAASASDRTGWDALGGLYALLAQHDALGGHTLARKSVRSPSRRLRFGRRSDPDMPPQPPVSYDIVLASDRYNGYVARLYAMLQSSVFYSRRRQYLGRSTQPLCHLAPYRIMKLNFS